jgi:hypothetical protein
MSRWSARSLHSAQAFGLAPYHGLGRHEAATAGVSDKAGRVVLKLAEQAQCPSAGPVHPPLRSRSDQRLVRPLIAG